MRHKAATLVLLRMAIGCVVGFVVINWWLKFLLGIVTVGATIHLIMIKTWRPEPPNQSKNRILLIPLKWETFNDWIT